MSVTIGVLNQKGGVGKTTTTVNVGAALAELGRSVLMIDLDPQGNMSTHLGFDNLGVTEDGTPSVIDEVDYASVYDVLKGQKTISEVTLERSKNLSYVPSSLLLSAADLELGGMVGRELLLKHAIQKVENQYDFVLIDCPPSLGLLTLNALAAVDKVIIPVQSEFLALHGVRQLLDTIDQVRNIYNPSLSVGGVLICLHDNRRKLARAVSDTIRSYFGDLVFEQVIRANVSLAEAPSQGQTIFEYAPKSAGAEDYAALAEEVINE